MASIASQLTALVKVRSDLTREDPGQQTAVFAGEQNALSGKRKKTGIITLFRLAHSLCSAYEQSGLWNFIAETKSRIHIWFLLSKKLLPRDRSRE